MRILITGGAGFIGSHLAKRLLSEKYTVSIIDNLSTGTLNNLGESLSALEFIEGDICDYSIVQEVSKKVDVIFHLAAAVGVRNIINDPIGSLKTNFNGSENVINASTIHKKRLFIASTSEVYGKNPKQPLSETDDRIVGSPQKLRWTYADAKALEEALAYSLYLEKGLEVTTLRFFNTVGPKQTGAYGMVIPRFIHSAKENNPIEVYGDGSQTRVFCHVSDVVDALILLLHEDRSIGEVFNVGGMGEISIKNLAQTIKVLTHSQSKIVFRKYEDVFPDTFEDMHRRVPNIDKLTKLIPWTPHRDLQTIIKDIINE